MSPASNNAVAFSTIFSALDPCNSVTRSSKRTRSQLCHKASSRSFKYLRSGLSPSPYKISRALASASARVAPSAMPARTKSSKLTIGANGESRRSVRARCASRGLLEPTALIIPLINSSRVQPLTKCRTAKSSQHHQSGSWPRGTHLAQKTQAEPHGHEKQGV